MLCGSPASCVDTTSSTTNCGGCGTTCTGSETCTHGTCSGGGGGAGGSAGAGGSGGAGGAGGTGGTGGGTIAGETLPGPTFVTSAQGAYWQTGTTITVTAGTATLTVNDGTAYQTFNGFGGAFNEKGWNYLQMLSATDLQQALTLLFDWTNGAHFVFGRVPIGASDYAMSRYTDDDTADDYTMSSFSITRDKQYLIPYVQAALAINPQIELWGSPWTPPAWMKENGNSSSSDGFPDDGGTMSNTAQILQAFALYEAKWVQAYAGVGITISTLMPQNEPNYSTPYPSCLWPTATYDTFVAEYLGPEFASQNVGAQIYLGTMSNNDSGTDPAIVAAVTADSTTMKYIKGFGMQWNEITDVPNVTKYDLPIWQTEHKAGNYPWGGETTLVNVGSAPVNIAFNMTTAPNDFDYALESFGLIGQWLQTGVNTYSAWNMVLDTVGLSIAASGTWPQNALLTVDTSSKTLNITPTYYVFRHFSQFIAPGAVRVGTSGSSLVSYAFKNPDGSHAVIMYNASSSPVQTIASVGGSMVQFTVPANAFATLKT
jgi:glucosylceramidase